MKENPEGASATLISLPLDREISKKLEVPTPFETNRSPFSFFPKNTQDLYNAAREINQAARNEGSPSSFDRPNFSFLTNIGTSPDGLQEKDSILNDELVINDENGTRTIFEDIIETQIDFNLSQFLEFLLYHFLFFFVLGPFTYAVLSFFTSKQVLRNQYFWGFNWMFFQQIFQYCLLTSSLLIYHNVSTVRNIYSIEIYMLVASILLRITIISLKYGSMDPARVALLKRTDLTIDQNFKEYMLVTWREQSDQIIEEEISNSLSRERIDTCLFYFNFFLEPSPNNFPSTLRKNPKKFISLFVPYLKAAASSTISRSFRSQKNLKDLEIEDFLKQKDIKTFKRFNLIYGGTSPYEGEMYFGYHMVREIMIKSRRSLLAGARFALTGTIITVVHAIIPSLWRYFDRGTFLGRNPEEICLNCILITTNFYFFLANFSFMILGVFDMKRRFFSLRELSRLLELKSLHKKRTSLMIDFLSEVSLNTWGNMYRLATDYGLKYYFRINGIVTLFLGFYLSLGLLLVLMLFEVISILRDPLLIIVFGFEVATHLIAIVIILFYGASNNMLLFENKKNLKEIKDIFFQLEMFLDEEDRRKISLLPHSYIIQVGLLRLKENVQGVKPDELRLLQRAKLQKLGKCVSMLLQQQSYRAKYFPVKFLGVTANFTILRRGLLTLCSIIFGVIQYYLNKLYRN